MKRRQAVLNAVLLIITFIIIAPLVWIAVMSFFKKGFSDEKIFFAGFDAYIYIIKDNFVLLRASALTFLYSAATAVGAAVLMPMLGFSLSTGKMPFKRVIYAMLFAAMLFSGVSVAAYILQVKALHMGDTIFSYILPYLVVPEYVLVLTAFFKRIPQNIGEQAQIDGANEWQTLFSVYMPMSKPIIITIAILIFISRWNDTDTYRLYINSENLFNVQYYIHNIYERIFLKAADNAGEYDMMESVKFAATVLGALPILVLAPILGKYVSGGIICGRIK